MSTTHQHQGRPPRRRRRAAGLLATSILLVAVAASSSAAAGFAGAGDVESCAQEKRALRPTLGYVAAVVRCVKIASVRTTMASLWTTCTKRTAARGERCETGSATLDFRSQTTQFDWRRKVPKGASGWHVYNGHGTFACRRDRNDLAAGDPDARREGGATINHLDALVWPTGAAGKVSAGVYPWPYGGLFKWKGDAGEVCPFWLFVGSSTAPFTPPSTSFAAARLLAPASISYTTTSTRSTRLSERLKKLKDGPVGSKRIRVTTRVTATITFKLRPGAS